MNTFTATYMAVTMPSCEYLQSIGSVAANSARTAEEEAREEFLHYSNQSCFADYILAAHGHPAYEAYIADSQAERELQASLKAERRARREARRQRIRVFLYKMGFKALVMGLWARIGKTKTGGGRTVKEV